MVEKPEQLMQLVEYMEAWQRALDRQKEREEAEDHVEEEGEVVVEGEGAQSEDETKSKDENMEVDKETENGHESNTGQSNTENGHSESGVEMFKRFAFCKGFTDEDCDVEEYFEENHENVEQVIFSKITSSLALFLTQVWQRGEGEGCEVFVKFKDEIAVQRFLTLNYVRYRNRPITVSTVKEKGDLAEYLAC